MAATKLLPLPCLRLQHADRHAVHQRPAVHDHVRGLAGGRQRCRHRERRPCCLPPTCPTYALCLPRTPGTALLVPTRPTCALGTVVPVASTAPPNSHNSRCCPGLLLQGNTTAFQVAAAGAICTTVALVFLMFAVGTHWDFNHHEVSQLKQCVCVCAERCWAISRQLHGQPTAAAALLYVPATRRGGWQLVHLSRPHLTAPHPLPPPACRATSP